MKSFFEFLGFLATAALSCFLVFLYIGHTKTKSKTETRTEIRVSDSGIESEEEHPLRPKRDPDNYYSPAAGETVPDAPALASFGAPKERVALEKRKPKTASSPEKRPSEKAKTSSPAKDLTNLYEDESFAEAAIKEWKNAVSEAAREYDLRADLLMANALIRSYSGNYLDSHFDTDCENHLGDRRLPLEGAIANYPNGKMVSKLVRIYGLEERFPAAAPKLASKSPEVSFSKKGKTAIAKKPEREKTKSKSKAEKPETKPRPFSKQPKNVADFRELVAREEGYRDWKGLLAKADTETQRRASKRVKVLLSSSRIR